MTEHPETLTRGEWYKLTAGGDAEVVALLDGSEVLLTAQDGAEQNAPAFQAPTENIIVRTDAPYVILPCEAANDGSGVNKNAITGLIDENNEGRGRLWNLDSFHLTDVFMTTAERHWEYPLPHAGILSNGFYLSSLHYFAPEGGCPKLRVADGAFMNTHDLEWCVCDFPCLFSAVRMFAGSNISYFRTNNLGALYHAEDMFKGSKLDAWSIINILNHLPDWSAREDELHSSGNDAFGDADFGTISFEGCPGCEYAAELLMVNALRSAIQKGWYVTLDKTYRTLDSLPVPSASITLPPEPPAPKRWNQLTANVQMLTLPPL